MENEKLKHQYFTSGYYVKSSGSRRRKLKYLKNHAD